MVRFQEIFFLFQMDCIIYVLTYINLSNIKNCLGPNWILTAAHCCHGPNPNAYKTVVNERDTAFDSPQDGSTFYTPAQIVRHPMYNETTKSNDFCLLRYDTPLVFDDNVAPACLPEVADQEPINGVNSTCYTAGWGLMDPTNPTSEARFLQEAQVQLVSNADCNANTSYNGLVDDSMLCAGTMEGGIDTCQEKIS